MPLRFSLKPQEARNDRPSNVPTAPPSSKVLLIGGSAGSFDNPVEEPSAQDAAGEDLARPEINIRPIRGAERSLWRVADEDHAVLGSGIEDLDVSPELLVVRFELRLHEGALAQEGLLHDEVGIGLVAA